jgi:very-short-patch-repair endonuclease
MAPVPRIPIELTTGPFDLIEARRHELSRAQLLGASWKRIGPGLYASRAIADQPLVQLQAAMRRLPGDAVLSGRTAAWLHGLDQQPCSPVEATCLRTAHLSGLAIRRCRLGPDDIVLRKGFRATSIVRTLADLERRLPLIEAVVLADEALHKRLLRLDQLRGRVAELAEPATESQMESRLRMILVLAGLPRPRVQVSLGDPFIARVDLYYPDNRLVIEYDGATHRESLVADNRRQNRLINAGFRILRFTASDLKSDVAGIVRRALS